jgi:2-C-methyl-D-erythritol 4-phosphate cytidylyltransferase
MVEWSIAAFRAADRVRSIVVACPPGLVHDLGDDLSVVDGGETRAESVASALGAVETELVAVHDAARPLITTELIEGTLDTLLADDDAAGAIAATPVTDTIKQVGAGKQVGKGEAIEPAAEDSNDLLTTYGPYGVTNSSTVVEATLDRGRLWAAQTPQVFRTEALRRAVGAAESAPTATDEAMLIEAAGGRVLIHPAPPENMKITTPRDLRLAELLLAERSGAGGQSPDELA